MGERGAAADGEVVVGAKVKAKVAAAKAKEGGEAGGEIS